MSSKKKTKALLLGTILILAGLLRFSGLGWGEGHYFHPDENNMAQAVLALDKTGRPDFYAYGQLPLFLALFSARSGSLFSLVRHSNQLDFSKAIFFLRFWSASAGTISVLLVYLLGRKLVNIQGGIIAAAITAFLPGLIQAGHFGTTESLLTFFYLAIAYCSLKIYQEIKLINFIASGLFLGLALATKISAGLFFLLPLAAVSLNLKKEGGLIKNRIVGLVLLSLLALMITLVFSPFLIINFSQSLSTLKYEIAVAKGKIIPFYTRQFLTTAPFWFHIKKILPFLLGWPAFIVSIRGIIGFIQEKKGRSLWLVVLFPSLIFFLYQGQLFAKWTRFLVPITPIFSLLFAQATSKISKPLQYIVVIISCLPGVFFFDLVYNQSDTRYQFSSWAKENLPQTSIILSESGNVVNLPLDADRQIINFDFYQLEEEGNLDLLCQHLKMVDYIIVPNRRVFANHPSSSFPATANYYQKLFSDQLGFSLIKIFSPNSRYYWANYYYRKSELEAEETWTVFDHPTIRLYQKTIPFSTKDYQNILSQ
ncbi:MAG: glycosyltransferase family 39 protein [Candidatus Shapirobacteria bacterium]|nr:glycosyltransferase family 39 protein [Candidatus Shapirobacteria bacterium]